MKFSKKIMTLVGICIISFISSMTGYIFGTRVESKTPQVNTASKESIELKDNQVRKAQAKPKEVAQKEVTPTYVIKEHEGRLAVFFRYSDGSEKLHESYDAEVSLLPLSDREMLKTGIEVETLSDALQIIEDFSS